jgi:hypothetical protein
MHRTPGQKHAKRASAAVSGAAHNVHKIAVLVVHEGVGKHEHDSMLKVARGGQYTRVNVFLDGAQVHGPKHRLLIAWGNVVGHWMAKQIGIPVGRKETGVLDTV